MAVVEVTANSDLAAGRKQDNFAGGALKSQITETVTMDASDDPGSTYTMGIIDGNERPWAIYADSAGTGINAALGVYKWNFGSSTLGDAVDTNLFDAVLGLGAKDNEFVFTAPAVGDRGKTVNELLVAAGVTENNDLDQYALVLTILTNSGGPTGDVTLRYESIKGV